MITPPNSSIVPIDTVHTPPASVPVKAVSEAEKPTNEHTQSEDDQSEKSARFKQAAEFSLRLTIDRDSNGHWIYKAVDRITGEVIKQFPREELLKMKRGANYKPGDVIKTQA